jgi:aryl-alcohol dehydrogenase-like predicted oxidoreductase
MNQNITHKIGLGTVQFGLDYGISNEGGRPNLEQILRILEMASHEGLDVLDTAAGYGESEAVLGQCLKSLPPKTFKIITKFMCCSSEMELRDQFSKSLERLKVGDVYGLLAHRPLELVEFPEIWKGLQKLKTEGLVVKVGYSLNTLEEFQQLENMHETLGYPDLVQVPFNYFDNRFVEVMKKLKSKGCEIHSRSAFLQGLFFMSIDKLSSHFDEVKTEIQGLQERFGEGLSGVLLNYALEKEYIDRVIIGVQNADQLNQNIAGVKASLSNKNEILDCTQTFSEEILLPSNWKK